MLRNSQKKKEFECKIEYLMRNSCGRCPKNRICEESFKEKKLIKDEQWKKTRIELEKVSSK